MGRSIDRSPKLPTRVTSVAVGGFNRVPAHGGHGWVQPLIQRAVRGDMAAFEQLIEPHLTPLYRLAAAMVGPEEARDVTQETLVNAWRELHRLHEAEKLEAWLRSILMNRARNVLRTRRRRPEVAYEPMAGHGIGHFEEPMVGLHGRWAVEDALAELRPEERAVVVLHYLADLTQRQVAETLGLREGTVKSRLHTGLRALRHHFAEDKP